MKPSLFPKGFLWGASTAAHQVEGNTRNQWSVWERANANRLASTFTRRLAWLPNLKDVAAAGTDPDNYLSGNGVEHYERFREDFALLERLNMNAFRFSIEWSRLEPEEGVWDEEAITHYRVYIAELKRRNIEPVLTLWHWTMPQWFTKKGGFEKRRNLHYFDRFVRKVTETYGTTLRRVITLNEPNVYVMLSYITGEWPPQRKNPVLALYVYRNLALAHRRAYAIIHQLHPMLQVGIAMSVTAQLSKDAHDRVGALRAGISGYLWNYWFLDWIQDTQHFIGINYYMADYYQGFSRYHPDPPHPKSDLGWSMDPSRIETVLTHAWKRYKLPIIVTENGLADAKDTHRQWWLEQTIAAMGHAVRDGVNLQGYLHWSLLDNFEWAYGWWPKFGLIGVDRTTMRRTIRPSALWLGEWLGQNTTLKNKRKS